MLRFRFTNLLSPRNLRVFLFENMFMASESSSELELGHVLFMDIVGYSKLLVDEQSEWLGGLTKLSAIPSKFGMLRQRER